MVPAKALVVALPLAVGSAWLAAHGAGRAAALRAELASAEGQGRDASAAVARLEPHAVEAQLAAFDRRRALAAELARARRDRVLGAVGLAAAALALAGITALSRVSAEVERERRRDEISPPRGGDGA